MNKKKDRKTAKEIFTRMIFDRLSRYYYYSSRYVWDATAEMILIHMREEYKFTWGECSCVFSKIGYKFSKEACRKKYYRMKRKG
jgi:hypothetical protein